MLLGPSQHEEVWSFHFHDGICMGGVQRDREIARRFKEGHLMLLLIFHYRRLSGQEAVCGCQTTRSDLRCTPALASLVQSAYSKTANL
jgi:hypothetical protein